MTDHTMLEQGIAALEAQRATLGDAVVDAAIAPIREKLAALSGSSVTPEQQRKQVTIVFADLSGFTAMSETMDAEEVGETMNALWQRLDRVIHAHGGWIDKHIGDAVMALWGVQSAHEDDPEQAIRAAITMQAAVGDWNTEHLHADPMLNVQQTPLAMRIGINTGPVLLGTIGSRGEFTAMGDSVNLASRLEHAAPVGGILIAHDTYRHVRGVFDVQSLQPITVKGKAQPVQVYVVQSIKPVTFRSITRGIEGIETPLRGREVELAQLRAAFQQLITTNQLHVITVTGEAGVGKSRLLDELSHWFDLQPQQLVYFKARATPETVHLPYGLLRSLFAFRFGMRESDSLPVVRQKLIVGLSASLGDIGATYAPLIGQLIGLDFSDVTGILTIPIEPRKLREQAFDAVVYYLRAMTQSAPAIVLLEDLHWADDASLDLLQHIIAQAGRDVPIFMIGLARLELYERRADWGTILPTQQHIALAPLSLDASRQVVADMLQRVQHLPLIVRDDIVDRAEGNPFYLEELIKMLIEEGVIETTADQWRIVTESLDGMRIPPTLTGILQARLDGLSPLERKTVQCAAVVGRHFWDLAVQRLSGDARIDETFVELQKKQLVYPQAISLFAGTRECSFKHALLREVSYESVLKRVRRVYHAQVADWLIERSGPRAGEYAGLIGEHYERAGHWVQTAHWYTQAARHAEETYVPNTAILYYQKAIAALQKNRGSEMLVEYLPLYEGLSRMLRMQARYDEMEQSLLAMRDTAQHIGDAAAQARAWIGLAQVHDSQRNINAMLESISQAEMIAEAADASAELGIALLHKGWALCRLHQANAALGLANRALEINTMLGAQREIGMSLSVLVYAHSVLGHYTQASYYGEQALLIYQALGDQRRMVAEWFNLGTTAERQGNYTVAGERFAKALELARSIGDRPNELFALLGHGHAQIMQGEWREGSATVRQVIALVDDRWIGLSEAYRVLAEALLYQGNSAEALITAQHALILAQTRDSPESLGPAWRVLGMCAAETGTSVHIAGNSYTVATCFAQSAQILAVHGLDAERARTLRAWAHFASAQGHVTEAETMRQTAQAIFARLDLPLETARMYAG